MNYDITKEFFAKRNIAFPERPSYVTEKMTINGETIFKDKIQKKLDSSMIM